MKEGLVMRRNEADYFIEELRTIGDEWTPEQVMEAYGDTPLVEAIRSRKRDVANYFNMINAMLNRRESKIV